MTTKLLIVDDDAELRNMLRDFFREAGLSVSLEADGPLSISRLEMEPFDLMILDVMLPGMSGFEILRQIRQRSRLPVILLTARSGRFDRLQGFESGADDYLAKPFFPEELLARVKAILRRSAPQLPNAVEALREGDLTVFPGSRSAFFQGRQLDLTAMECEILEQLLRSSGRVVSRDQLSIHLYNRVASPYDRSIDTHVSRIRRKLGEGRGMIASIRGTGYQLCCGQAQSAT